MVFKLFYSLWGIPRLERDLLDHPDIARMTPRELADLPLPRPPASAKDKRSDP